MVSLEHFRKLALSLPEATEEPHFEKSSFRVRKKIFATAETTSSLVVVKLSPLDQSVFCAQEGGAIIPVKGAWGKKGWTHADLSLIHPDLLEDLLITAYVTVAPKKLGALVRPPS
ncbi:MAG: MmcQ/YjbR family DNA-binding protein [Bacteroidota bacterium]